MDDHTFDPQTAQDWINSVEVKGKTLRDDDIYPALQFLYRYAMTRNTFEPTTFLGAFYNNEGDAQNGANPVANIWREHGDKGPKCENAIKLEFAEEVQKSFVYSLGRAEVDLVIGNWLKPPGELHLGKLLSDEVVCLVAEDHPAARSPRAWTPQRYLESEHVAPTPMHPGARGFIDEYLDSQGLARNMMKVMPRWLVLEAGGRPPHSRPT